MIVATARDRDSRNAHGLLDLSVRKRQSTETGSSTSSAGQEEIVTEIPIHPTKRSLPWFEAPLDLSSPKHSSENEEVCQSTSDKSLISLGNEMRQSSTHQPLPAPTCNHPKLSSKSCLSQIPYERRLEICTEFQRYDIATRSAFLLNHCERLPVQQRRKENQEGSSRRRFTFHFFLEDFQGVRVPVCKPFFMSTIGKKTNSDRIIHHIFEQNSERTFCAEIHTSDRGRKVSIPSEEMKTHILAFKPEISHYRRKHAPKRLYLSDELSVSDMYTDFLEKSGLEVSYESYRSMVRSMNISFAKLGSEECELCDRFLIQNDPSISQQKYDVHKKKYTNARIHYDADSKEQQSILTKIIFSVDMEKVMQVPFLPCYKSGIFTSGVTVFNETFVPVGVSRLPVFSCIWHDGVSGRNAEELISAFHQFFLQYRDCPSIIIWCDNCTAQNKNWKLFSYLVFIINSSLVRTIEITFKFFEPGHSGMSADAFHHRVEESIKKRKVLHDYFDFVSSVETAKYGSGVKVREMSCDDFLQWADLSSKSKLKKNPKLRVHNMVCVKATRGNYSLAFKSDHNGEYEELDFLLVKAKNGMRLPTPIRSKPKGISSEKKKTIIEKLCPLMPADRKSFWNFIETSEEPDFNLDLHLLTDVIF